MNDDLRKLADDYWQWNLESSPSRAHLLGDHRYDDRFEEASREAEDRLISDLRRFVERASSIDAATLSSDERVSVELLSFDAETRADQLEMRHAEFGANHAIGTQAMLPTRVTQFPVTEPEHADAMVEKFAGIGRAIRQEAHRLREGAASGRTPHQYTVAATIPQIEEHLATSIDDDPYLRVQAPAAFSDADEAAWRDRLKAAVEEHIRPAWAEYHEVLANEVTPAARPDAAPGVCHLPDGEELYRRAIRRHTSVERTAEEIHQIGLDQIAALEDEYRTIGASALGIDDVQEIYARLRDDPALRFDSSDAVVAASEVALASARDAMGDWFGRLPVADCVVGSVTAGPLAFYMVPATDGSRPGTFYVNTNDPTSWQTFFVEAMAFHEGIPGHHLQLAIASEFEDLPDFRRHLGVTAYAEGWGLYAERLADEMGIYTDDFTRLGMLMADSMRASRLVVDTGMHALGWSRGEAIEFMASNGPMSRPQVEAEIDRYLGMPGQALAYMVGRLEIVRYRREAEATMGDRFDIRGFHDVVIGSGMVPLPTLERLVSEWASAA